MQKLDKPLKYIEITIIDGENLKTDLVLDIIYPNVNYLNLIDKLENFKEKSIDIYEDGLICSLYHIIKQH